MKAEDAWKFVEYVHDVMGNDTPRKQAEWLKKYGHILQRVIDEAIDEQRREEG